MGFSTKQVRALGREIDSRKIRTRQVNGRELSYIEGWHAIAEANRIFGADGWSRETIETRSVLSRETRGSFLAIYAAKVRITVFANGRTVVREGHGTGEGNGPSAGETHDIALKAAETDATKRALATFGKPFGLSLYLIDRGRAAANERRQLFSPRYRPTPSAVIPPIPAEPAPEKEPEAHVPEPIPATPTQVMQTPECGPELVLALQANQIVAPQNGLPFGVPRRIRDRNHLKFVTNQPCLQCGRWPSDAHHLTFAQPRAMGMKVGDEFTVPLCRLHHRGVHHARNELAWWSDLKIDPIDIAKKLWQQSHAKSRNPPADENTTSA
jgi:Rad52/22 family double-strand break repair protein